MRMHRKYVLASMSAHVVHACMHLWARAWACIKHAMHVHPSSMSPHPLWRANVRTRFNLMQVYASTNCIHVRTCHHQEKVQCDGKMGMREREAEGERGLERGGEGRETLQASLSGLGLAVLLGGEGVGPRYEEAVCCLCVCSRARALSMARKLS